MRVRHAVGAGVLVLAAAWGGRAEDPKADEYARVEVRGKLARFEPSPIRNPQVWWYSLKVGQGKGAQFFRLDLTNEALRKLGKELDGQAVVVAGDLAAPEPEGADRPNPLHRNVIRVKTLKKADQPKK